MDAQIRVPEFKRMRPWLGSILLPFLLACTEQAPEDDVTQSYAVYRHALDGAPGNLDPARASNIYANFLVVNLYDTLYRYKYLAKPAELAPNLAENLPQISADGLIYTIRIKAGVHFNDDAAFPENHGRVVTAEDFVYSIKRHFHPSTVAHGTWLWRGKIVGLEEWQNKGADFDTEVSGLRALDERTIQIQLVKPFPQLIHTLTQGYSAIVPREAVEHYGEEFGIHPVGSGPYTLRDFDSSRAALVRNIKFRQEPISLAAEGYNPETQRQFGLEVIEGRSPPLTGRIELEFITEDASRWSAFTAGEVDFLKVPVSQFDTVLASRSPPAISTEIAKNNHFRANMESGFVHTMFNMDDPRIGYHRDPDQNKRNHALRCSIIKAFDWPRQNEIFYYGLGAIFAGIIPPAAPEFDPNQSTATVTRDVEGARRLMADFGWNAENLPELEYGISSSVTERQMFEQFRSFMADIGYPSEKIKPLTFATYADYARAYLNREVMLITSGWTMDYPDAENTMQLFFGPNATPGANHANYNNEEYNRIYRSSSEMQPSPMRTAMYRNMNRLLQEDCATISGISRTLILLWNKDFAMLPDRDFLGGHFFRFVSGSLAEPAQAQP